MEFHAHDFLELYYFLDGSVTYYIEDQVYDLCPGDLLIIPAGKMHRPVIANEHAAYERMVLWITPQYLQGIDSPAGDRKRWGSTDTACLFAAMKRCSSRRS